ncbi:hypothetical protein BD311DRAFT_125731 [Dichomitus squalens]|uniref:Uncharacterized protein n=1 Tax=Dichomitus squalens TaxID=114155 RepID=A0A4V2JYW5_9APHY|nr:hypothetical protein BD311DRAFT_125731 [Dichomitus squalens]
MSLVLMRSRSMHFAFYDANSTLTSLRNTSITPHGTDLPAAFLRRLVRPACFGWCRSDSDRYLTTWYTRAARCTYMLLLAPKVQRHAPSLKLFPHDRLELNCHSVPCEIAFLAFAASCQDHSVYRQLSPARMAPSRRLFHPYSMRRFLSIYPSFHCSNRSQYPL